MRRVRARLQTARAAVTSARQLRILIVGFGNFGQFVAKTFVKLGHLVIGLSRSDHAVTAAEIGAEFVRDPCDAMARNPHVVLFSTSILSTAAVLDSFPKIELSGRLVVDVLSVKEYPKTLLLSQLPEKVDILCTHPMFGPESGRHGWQGLPFVYERVRISDGQGAAVCEEFLHIWRNAGCRMVEMTCEQHDSFSAASQFITHTTGRMLAELRPEATPIDTKGYESLLGLIGNTVGDSFDLYCGLFYYNAYSKRQLQKMEEGLRKVKASLEQFEAKQLAEDGGPGKKWGPASAAEE